MGLTTRVSPAWGGDSMSGAEALIVAATLSAPTQSKAAETAEASQLLLPGIGLVGGLISGKIMGASVGIAAFATAISGKVPGAIISGLISAALAAHLAPPTMSLAQALLVGVAVVRLALQLGDGTWQDLVNTFTEFARRAGNVVRWAGETISRLWKAKAEAAEQIGWVAAPQWPQDRFLEHRPTTVVGFGEVANPGGLVPNLAPVAESWKGQPIR